MQLTKHTDFAFRTLMYLALMPSDQATIKEIAERFDIPKSHLMKVANSLVHHGLVQASRGKTGGIRLAKKPEEIGLRQVVEWMENTLEPLDCAGQPCVILKSCQLKFKLSQARDAFLDSLGQFTLADVIDTPTRNELHTIQLHLG